MGVLPIGIINLHICIFCFYPLELELLGRGSTLFSRPHNYIYIYNIYIHIFIFRTPMGRTPLEVF